MQTSVRTQLSRWIQQRVARRPLVTAIALVCLLAMSRSAAAQAGLYGFNPAQATPGTFSAVNAVRVFVTAADGHLSLLTTLTGFNEPEDVVVRGDQRFAYVFNFGANNVMVIDTATMTVVQTIAAGNRPSAGVLRPDGRRLYVSNNTGNTVSVFDADLTTGRLTLSSTIAVAGNPLGLALSPDTTRLYVVANGSNNVKVINTATNTIIATIGVGSQPQYPTVSPDGTRVLVTNQSGGTVSMINAATNTVSATLTTPGVFTVNHAKFSPDGRFYYITGNTNGRLIAYDASTDTLIENVVLSSPPGTVRDLVIDPEGQHLYAMDWNNGILHEFAIDPVTGLFTRFAAPTFDAVATLGICGPGMLGSGATFPLTDTTALGCLGATPTFTGGTLQITTTGLTIPTAFTLGSGGGTIDTNGNSTTIAGAFSGGGTLTKVGAGSLTAGAAAVLSSSSALTISAGTVALNTFDQTVGSLAGSGTVDLGSATLTTGTDNTSTTFSGTMSGAGGLTKSGTGIFTLTGTNSYTGTTTVNGGTLLVGGNLAGALTVASGGTVNPGTSGAGLLNTGSLTVNAGGAMAVDLNGPAAGTQYDRLTVTGTVTLGGTLSASLGFVPATGQVLTIIDNDGADAIVGTFAGLPQGAILTASGKPFQISYTGGTGNDVTLTYLGLADVSVTNTGPAGITAGQNIVYTILVANSGLDIAGNVVVSDPTPAGLTFVSNSGACATAFPCSLGALASGQSATITATFSTTTATRSGGVPNTVTVATTSVDSVSGNNTATAITNVGCVSIVVTPTTLSTGIAGTAFSQVFTLSSGTAPATFALTGALPTGVTFSGGTLSGTPSVRGSFPLTLGVTDANGCQASVPYTLSISRERFFAVGAGAGGASDARTFGVQSAVARTEVRPFGSFPGGTSVALGDTNGDGQVDLITGAGPGGGPVVQVIDGGTGDIRLSFFAYEATLTSGVEVASADVNNDGIADIVTVPGPGSAPLVRVFDGRTGAMLSQFEAMIPSWTYGLHVAAGDVNGDGAAEIIIGSGPNGPPLVQVFTPQGVQLRQFLAYAPTFFGGVYVAAGDVTGDGIADIVTGAGPGGSPQVHVFDGVSGAQIAGPLGDFLAYTPAFGGGVRVAAGDFDGDGRAEVITAAGPGGGPHTRVWDGATGTETFGLYAFDPSFAGGVFVAGPPSVGRMNIDLPAPGSTIGQVRVAGWALRETSLASVGTDAIHVWAYPVSGGSPTFVAAAPVRTPRPDVAAYFGGEFLMSGFDFTGTLPSGTYDLVIYARNDRTFVFDQVRVVHVIVQ